MVMMAARVRPSSKTRAFAYNGSLILVLFARIVISLLATPAFIGTKRRPPTRRCTRTDRAHPGTSASRRPAYFLRRESHDLAHASRRSRVLSRGIPKESDRPVLGLSLARAPRSHDRSGNI